MAQEIADSTLLDTWASGGNIVEPDISKIIEGWQLGEQPPHEYMNWLQNTFGSKLNHILKNGVVKWESEKEFLAGATVQHNGNVWLCKTTNTNSEPTDVNANWKRIITIESLTTVLAGYVATTGDQTIAGVKTFSSNPISSATQSTNSNALTKYSAVVKNSGDETIAGVKTFSSTIAGSINGNAATATKLATARTINGVSFDGSANITVSDSTAVKLTTDQTIAGVKTFSSNPIVPTPTTGTQVANKDYVDANAGISLTTANSYDLGVGQTYQDVTASRTTGVTYTNTTGKAIEVTVSINGSGVGTTTINGYVNGSLIGTQSSSWGSSGTGTVSNFSMVVPSGATYNITTSGSAGISMNKWSELR